MLYDGKLWVAPISSLSCPKNCHYVNKYYEEKKPRYFPKDKPKINIVLPSLD